MDKIIFYCKNGFFLSMLDSYKPHPGECAQIIGYRTKGLQILYTIRFTDYSTIDVPCKESELLKFCSSLLYQLCMENSD